MEPTQPPLPPPPGVISYEAMANQPVPARQHVTGAGIMESGSSSLLLVLTPASHHLLAHARQLLGEGKYQFAVLFAHAACELDTEGALKRLLTPRKDRDLVELVAPHDSEVKSLDIDRIRKLYKVLTGDNPKDADWWKPWLQSRQDRHAVAHRGAQMSETQALTAIDTADKYIKHVTQKVEDALNRPPTPGPSQP
jgi:HEPN domain-containing protein